MIVIQGDWYHSEIIRKYFENIQNRWCFDSKNLYYTEFKDRVISYRLEELPKDAIILTYKDLEEL